MKIRRLDLENFRQFYGRQGLSFSTDPTKNVTLVYGSNGAGKTTILNAFTWGLYGETTPGLDQSEWLINNLAWSEAVAGDTVTARVKIEFEDKDHVYELERVQTATKRPDGEAELRADKDATLRVTDSAGQNEEIENIEGAIGSILPKRLHRFAFFDGERDIEHLASPDATEKIEDAIKTVLGLEVLERAIAHTKRARTSELNPELSKLGDKLDQELTDHLSQLEEKDGKLIEELDQLKQNLAATEKDLTRVDDELGKIKAAEELQKRRREIEMAVETAGERIEGADRGLDDKVRRSGFLAFVPKLIETAGERSRGLHEKGEIPAPIKQPFVQELLNKSQCICGTELKEGSSEQEAVMAWFEKAGLPEMEARWSRIEAHTLNFRARRDELYLYLDETIKERFSHEHEQKLWEQRESEIEEEMGGVDDELVHEMNDKRRTLRGEIESIQRQIGGCLQKRKEVAADTLEAETELATARDESQRAAKARKRVNVAREVEEVCRQLLDLRTKQTRGELDERLKNVFGEMCFRPFVPALTDEFRLSLSSMLHGDESPVAKSTGESQILALSFVGAMAELARKRYEESLRRGDGSGLLSFQGGVFPLVLDAVFGTLDDTYQDGVAESLPALAPQVIVLVTRGSAVDAIHERLWPKTGKTAVCTLYTSADGAEDTKVEVPGASAPYRASIGDERDRSEIVEV